MVEWGCSPDPLCVEAPAQVGWRMYRCLRNTAAISGFLACSATEVESNDSSGVVLRGDMCWNVSTNEA
jgi:hypothetical protein